MQFQTLATLLTLIASTLSLFSSGNTRPSSACRPIYKDIVYNCGPPSDLLTIQSISISPDSPVHGQNIAIKAIGYLKETVTGGNIHVESSYMFFKATRDYDLCENANKAGKMCAFERGEVIVDTEVEIDRKIPPNKYDIDVVATSNTNKVIATLNLKVRVR